MASYHREFYLKATKTEFTLNEIRNGYIIKGFSWYLNEIFSGFSLVFRREIGLINNCRPSCRGRLSILKTYRFRRTTIVCAVSSNAFELNISFFLTLLSLLKRGWPGTGRATVVVVDKRCTSDNDHATRDLGLKLKSWTVSERERNAPVFHPGILYIGLTKAWSRVERKVERLRLGYVYPLSYTTIGFPDETVWPVLEKQFTS